MMTRPYLRFLDLRVGETFAWFNPYTPSRPPVGRFVKVSRYTYRDEQGRSWRAGRHTGVVQVTAQTQEVA